MPLTGPYFEFLVFPLGEAWERRGGNQRPSGVRSACFHHPEALRVPACVVGAFTESFASAHPQFNFYGPTEYAEETLETLSLSLIDRLAAVLTCNQPEELQAMLPEWVVTDLDAGCSDWAQHWRQAQIELAAGANQILARIQAAADQDAALLVLGI